MINYQNCSNVDIDLIHEAFEGGFSDYIIKMNMSKEAFIKHFFGAEANNLKHSYIAFDGNKPVGLILGGIKNYEGIKTLRCGALCVCPDYRGRGISQRLFEYHKQVAINNSCKQLFLEVIVGNDRAINFYKRLGYEKIYDLSYYLLKDVNQLKRINTDSLISKITFKELRNLEEYIYDIHINWQNSLDYIEKLENQYHYGIYKDGLLVGAISINRTGNIHFLWVLPEFRNQRIASALLGYAVSELGLTKLAISFPNNSSLQGFVRKLGFEKSNISQYEMYYTL